MQAVGGSKENLPFQSTNLSVSITFPMSYSLSNEKTDIFWKAIQCFFPEVLWNQSFSEILISFPLSRMISNYCMCLSYQISPSPSLVLSLLSEGDGSKCILNDKRRGCDFVTAYVHYSMDMSNTGTVCC